MLLTRSDGALGRSECVAHASRIYDIAENGFGIGSAVRELLTRQTTGNRHLRSLNVAKLPL